MKLDNTLASQLVNKLGDILLMQLNGCFYTSVHLQLTRIANTYNIHKLYMTYYHLQSLVQRSFIIHLYMYVYIHMNYARQYASLTIVCMLMQLFFLHYAFELQIPLAEALRNQTSICSVAMYTYLHILITIQNIIVIICVTV